MRLIRHSVLKFYTEYFVISSRVHVAALLSALSSRGGSGCVTSETFWCTISYLLCCLPHVCPVPQCILPCDVALCHLAVSCRVRLCCTLSLCITPRHVVFTPLSLYRWCIRTECYLPSPLGIYLHWSVWKQLEWTSSVKAPECWALTL